MKKRIISLLLVLAMLFTLAPISIFAIDGNTNNTSFECYLNATEFDENGEVTALEFSSERTENTRAKYYYSENNDEFVFDEEACIAIITNGNACVNIDYDSYDPGELNRCVFTFGESHIYAIEDDEIQYELSSGNTTLENSPEAIVSKLNDDDYFSNYHRYGITVYKECILNTEFFGLDYIIVKENASVIDRTVVRTDSVCLEANSIFYIDENLDDIYAPYGLNINCNGKLTIDETATLCGVEGSIVELGDNAKAYNFNCITYNYITSDFNDYSNIDFSHLCWAFSCTEGKWFFDGDGRVPNGSFMLYYPQSENAGIYYNDELYHDRTNIQYEENETITLNIEYPEFMDEMFYIVRVTHNNGEVEEFRASNEDQFTYTPTDNEGIIIAFWFEEDMYNYNFFQPEEGEYLVEINSSGSGMTYLKSDDTSLENYVQYRESVKYSVSNDTPLKFDIVKSNERVKLQEIIVNDTSYSDDSEFLTNIENHEFYAESDYTCYNFNYSEFDENQHFSVYYDERYFTILADNTEISQNCDYSVSETQDSVYFQVITNEALEEDGFELYGVIVNYYNRNSLYIKANELINGDGFYVPFDGCSCNIDICLSPTPFSNEFTVSFVNEGNYYIKHNGNVIDNQYISSFTCDEENPIILELITPEDSEKPRIILSSFDINEDLSDLIDENNIFTYYPESSNPIIIKIYWTEEHYIFDTLHPEEGQYLIEYSSRGAGSVVLSSEGTQPVSSASYFDSTRAVFNCNDPLPTFISVPEEGFSLEAIQIDGIYMEYPEIDGYNDETGEYTPNNTVNERDIINIEFIYSEPGYIPENTIVYNYDDNRTCIISNGEEVERGTNYSYEPNGNINISFSQISEDDAFSGIRIVRETDGERTHQLIRAEDLSDNSITIDTLDYYYIEIEVLYYHTLFENCFSIEYDMRGDAKVYVNGEFVESGVALEFNPNEELVITFEYSDEIVAPYYVSMDKLYIEDTDITEDFSEGSLIITPETSHPFSIRVNWTEEEKAFNQITPDEDSYIIEYYINGLGNVQISDEGGQPIEIASYVNSVRAKFSIEGEEPVFILTPDEDMNIQFIRVRDTEYSPEECPNFDIETGKLLLERNDDNWFGFEANFSGIDENANRFYINYEPDLFTVLYNGVEVDPFNSIDAEEINAIEIIPAEGVTFYGLMIHSNYNQDHMRIKADKIENNIYYYTHTGTYTEIYITPNDELFDNEARYRSEYGTKVTLNGVEIENDTVFQFSHDDSLTFEFIPETEGQQVYAVELNDLYGNTVNLTELVENNILVLNLDNDNPFELCIWWTEEQYNYDHVYSNEEQSIVEIYLYNGSIEFSIPNDLAAVFNEAYKYLVPLDAFEYTITVTPDEGYKFSWAIINGNGFNENDYVINEDGSVTLTITKNFHYEYLNLIIVNDKEDDWILGDVDGNGKVTSADVNLMLQAISGLAVLDSTATLCADVNQDGKVNSADVNNLIKYVAGISGLGNIG